MVPTPPSTPRLPALLAVMARDSNLTFGGGGATAEVLRRSLTKRGWLTDEWHARVFAFSRLTPGTNLLAYCAGVGWLMRGGRGALVALMAASVPAAAIAVMATLLIESLEQSTVARWIVAGGSAIAVVLLLLSAWNLARPQLPHAAHSRLLVVGALSVGLLWVGVSPLPILVIAAAVGALWKS